MWRWFMLTMTVMFGIAAVAGLVLLPFLAFDGEWKQMPVVALGTALFTWFAFASRRDWQREQQRRAERIK